VSNAAPRTTDEPAHGSGGPAVLAQGLRKSFGERVAVDGIDFAVDPGTCVGFLGPNGAGKTTTMKMIYGLATVGEGSLSVLGMDAVRERRRVKERIGVVPQETNLDGELTVRENLLYHSRYFGVDPDRARERVDELLEFSLLTERAGDGDEAAAPDRPRAGQRSGPDRARRADHGARPAGAVGGLAGA
jgi:lipooligosaccharide transport system ATP-binding protein